MNKHNYALNNELDEDIMQALADNESAVPMPIDLKAKLRGNIMDRVAQEHSGEGPGYITVRASDDGWVEALPGGFIKILKEADENGSLTYLARLEPGFEMPSHVHEFGEECIMLEGELWMGDLHLKKGDYHYAAAGMKHGKHRSPTGALIYLNGPLPI
ncbi:cupin domain-containing protein [Leucothrix pacifica]|uniref:ChrR-like cupin domain-containing protein n=1 Tax=Leucothrix pacifica TaxID=1247513 RepID=A0A317CGB2_9GAMM|nr:cupin domain-containing protein [Leucothrix pacifica]PWQ96463.1 hypothetical protein DKW60_12960 [Leucothrix pacifica]